MTSKKPPKYIFKHIKELQKERSSTNFLYHRFITSQVHWDWKMNWRVHATATQKAQKYIFCLRFMILRLFQLTDSSSDEELESYQEKKVQFQISTRKGKFNSHHYYKNKQRKSASPKKGFRLSPVREMLVMPVRIEQSQVIDSTKRQLSTVKNAKVRVKIMTTEKS